MFRFYNESSKCYAYLSDVPYSGKPQLDDHCMVSFRASRWFTRGWTLQELLAPDNVQFFSAEWVSLGWRTDLSMTINSVTGIPQEYLLGRAHLHDASIAQRMAWAAARETTRREDIAYCLLGIFGVNMPMLYGEGDKAFIRLQEEILKESNDHSLLAWQCEDHNGKAAQGAGALAVSPADFVNSKHFIPRTKTAKGSFEMTKRGLLIELPVLTAPSSLSPIPLTYGILNCW
ncbi:hypothetical protein OQA88_11761 [Cercophora sp. LCS_1]